MLMLVIILWNSGTQSTKRKAKGGIRILGIGVLNLKRKGTENGESRFSSNSKLYGFYN